MTSHPLYMWHHSQYIGSITPTKFVNTYQLYWQEIHCFKTIEPLYMTSHSSSLSLCDHSHCIDDITHTLFMISYLLYIYMAQYALYMTSLPRFMTSQHSTHDIKAIISHFTPIIFDNKSTVSVSSVPDYQSYNPHFIYDNTATICMTSCELHMTSHPLFMISSHAMTSHPLYLCYHTQDTGHHIHCRWTIIIVYWLYHTYYMYELKPTICIT